MTPLFIFFGITFFLSGLWLFLPVDKKRSMTQDTIGLSTTARTALAQAIITAAGANAKFKFYNGTRPATGAAVTSQTLGATLIMGATIGTAGSGAIDIDEAGMTQNSANHVNLTPTWLRLTTSADVFVADFSIPADATFSGSISTNVNITMNASTITMPNA